ncbi:MAG: YbjN domain-containing protein, partial [Myxococcota bacterium]
KSVASDEEKRLGAVKTALGSMQTTGDDQAKQLLVAQDAELRKQLLDAQQSSPPQDYVSRVDMAVIETYLQRAGFPAGEQTAPDALLVPVEGQNTDFQVILQLFEREEVLYIAAHGYLQIEQAASSKAMVLLLTQVAALNYELLLGKFQLNPNTGSISLSVEIHLNDGLGFQTFNDALHHLVRTADTRYPELLRTAQSMGI